MTGVLAGYATALGLTLAVELPVYGVLLRRLGVRLRTTLLCGVGANLLTHPALWFCVRAYERGAGGYPAAVVVGEVLVCGVEWLVLLGVLRGHRIPVGMLATASVVANAASAAAGLLGGLLR